MEKRAEGEKGRTGDEDYGIFDPEEVRIGDREFGHGGMRLVDVAGATGIRKELKVFDCKLTLDICCSLGECRESGPFIERGVVLNQSRGCGPMHVRAEMARVHHPKAGVMA